MPIYDYQCKDCSAIKEIFSNMAEKPTWKKCPVCGGRALPVILKGHGGIQCDSAIDVPWLKSAEEVIKPECEKPWESRKDYNDHLKRNGLEPGR